MKKTSYQKNYPQKIGTKFRFGTKKALETNVIKLTFQEGRL